MGVKQDSGHPLGDWEDDHPTLEKEFSHSSRETYQCVNAIVLMVLMMVENPSPGI